MPTTKEKEKGRAKGGLLIGLQKMLKVAPRIVNKSREILAVKWSEGNNYPAHEHVHERKERKGNCKTVANMLEEHGHHACFLTGDWPPEWVKKTAGPLRRKNENQR